jgi:hypothetical protein
LSSISVHDGGSIDDAVTGRWQCPAASTPTSIWTSPSTAATRSTPLHELRQTRTIERQRERRDQSLARRVSDQRHRLVLADIHRNQQTLLRRHTRYPSCPLSDITTMNVHHDNTSGVSRDW